MRPLSEIAAEHESDNGKEPESLVGPEQFPVSGLFLAGGKSEPDKITRDVAPFNPSQVEMGVIRQLSASRNGIISLTEWLKEIGNEPATVDGQLVTNADGVPVSRLELAARMAFDALLTGELRFPGTGRKARFDARQWTVFFSDILRHVDAAIARETVSEVGGGNIDIMARAVVEILASAKTKRQEAGASDVIDVQATTLAPPITSEAE